MLVAASWTLPPFALRLVVTATPLPSTSSESVATVYLKVALVVVGWDRYVAYRVAEPTVIVRRGEPVIVTASEKFATKSTFCPGPYVAFAGGDTEEMVGGVRSIIRGVEVALEAGPSMPEVEPLTLLANKVRVTVPSVQLLSEIHLEEIAVEVVKASIVQMPLGLIVKSVESKPVTDSEKAIFIDGVVEFVVATAAAKVVTDGAGKSKVTKPTPLLTPIQLNPIEDEELPAPPEPPQPPVP